MSKVRKDTSGCKLVIAPKDSKYKVYICELGKEKTDGGIILPSKLVEEEPYKKTTGILVEKLFASKEDEEKCSLKLGDVLCFRPYSGIHKDGIDNCAYRLLEAHEIHSVETN